MRYIGVDPGANFTGVAVLEADGSFSLHQELTDPVSVWLVIEDETIEGVTQVILEDFIGGGQRDAYVTKTIKTVGYLENRCREAGVSIKLVNPQARLANVENVPKEITGKDEIAAAAHALSERERN
jgi:hypothetical protein